MAHFQNWPGNSKVNLWYSDYNERPGSKLLVADFLIRLIFIVFSASGLRITCAAPALFLLIFELQKACLWERKSIDIWRSNKQIVIKTAFPGLSSHILEWLSNALQDYANCNPSRDDAWRNKLLSLQVFLCNTSYAFLFPFSFSTSYAIYMRFPLFLYQCSSQITFKGSDSSEL